MLMTSPESIESIGLFQSIGQVCLFSHPQVQMQEHLLITVSGCITPHPVLQLGRRRPEEGSLFM